VCGISNSCSGREGGEGGRDRLLLKGRGKTEVKEGVQIKGDASSGIREELFTSTTGRKRDAGTFLTQTKKAEGP